MGSTEVNWMTNWRNEPREIFITVHLDKQILNIFAFSSQFTFIVDYFFYRQHDEQLHHIPDYNQFPDSWNQFSCRSWTRLLFQLHCIKSFCLMSCNFYTIRNYNQCYFSARYKSFMIKACIPNDSSWFMVNKGQKEVTIKFWCSHFQVFQSLFALSDILGRTWLLWYK